MKSTSGRGMLSLVRPGSALGSTVLFLGGGRAWTVDDAIADADARGALDQTIEEALALSAAEQRAEEDSVDIDDDAIQKDSERFRYDHDLITAGETEEWLAARGMTLEDFAAWLYRRLCADAVGRPSIDTVPDDFPELLHIHLWLSGDMERVADQFRRRIAAQMELAAENLSVEAAHDRVVASVLTTDARQRRLAAMRLPLTQLHIDSLELESEAAAREACLCVRDDGETLADLASRSGYTTKRESIWGEDAGRDLPPQALFASDGELIGPIHVENRFKVCQVVRRVEPLLADAAVAARVDAALLDEFFNELCARHTPLPVVARINK